MDKPFWQSKKFLASVLVSILGALPLVSMLLNGKDLSSVEAIIKTLLAMVGPSVYVGSQALVDSKVYPIQQALKAAAEAEKKSSP